MQLPVSWIRAVNWFPPYHHQFSSQPLDNFLQICYIVPLVPVNTGPIIFVQLSCVPRVGEFFLTPASHFPRLLTFLEIYHMPRSASISVFAVMCIAGAVSAESRNLRTDAVHFRRQDQMRLRPGISTNRTKHRGVFREHQVAEAAASHDVPPRCHASSVPTQVIRLIERHLTAVSTSSKKRNSFMFSPQWVLLYRDHIQPTNTRVAAAP